MNPFLPSAPAPTPRPEPEPEPHLIIRLIGEDPSFGPAVLTVRGVEITCRIDLSGHTTRYKCSSCGRLAGPCRHVSLAIAARAIQFRGDQP